MKIWDFEKYSNNTAVIGEFGDRLSYKDLINETDKLAGNIRKRSLVFSFCRNEVGSLLGYACFLNNEIVPIMLSAGIEKELLDNLFEKYKPDYLWFPTDMEGTFEGIDKLYETYGYTLAKTGFDISYPLYDELGLLLTTSGSTGSPQACAPKLRKYPE